jgi:manganese transport protein
MFTQNRRLMGGLVNHRYTTLLASLCAAIILALNVVLLYQTLGGQLPT